MRTLNGFKSSYKERNISNIEDQLYIKLEDLKHPESGSQVVMPECSLEQTEAIRRYYAAFPPLQKNQESTLQYNLPPPSWCRKPKIEIQNKMQCDLTNNKEWNSNNKKKFTGKERRNSYHGKKRNRRGWNYMTYSRSFESNKDSLPEWVTYEGVWDMENQDSVKEFIRALAFDEGYSTCENTITDDLREKTVKIMANESLVPDLDDGLDLDVHWKIPIEYPKRAMSPNEEQLYAKFEAKFDRSIEALWDQNTPDDEYQELPIDFQELLASPSDYTLAEATADKFDPISIESIEENGLRPFDRYNEWPIWCERGASALPEQLQPLNISDTEIYFPPNRHPIEYNDLPAFMLYDGVKLHKAVEAISVSMDSFMAINHSYETSCFVEVMPRRPIPLEVPPDPVGPDVEQTRTPVQIPPFECKEKLSSAQTHFRPIRGEPDVQPPRYKDGDTFDIRGDIDPVVERHTESGSVYIGTGIEPYLEYRATRTINYSRLNLTAEQRCPDLEDVGLRLRFPLRQHDAAVQTEIIVAADAWSCEECGHAAKKMRAGADPVWGETVACSACAAPLTTVPTVPPDDLTREWEELLSDISAAHARYAAGDHFDEGEDAVARMDRKRRHSASLRCAPACTHPHARFLACCTLAVDRPLTR